jgi:secondary thiamine-phosphate synthase enzyme
VKQLQKVLSIQSPGQGLHTITEQIDRVVQASGVETGLCTLFLRHTSASLVIQENADPSARHDLLQYFLRLVPEGDPAYTHTMEGVDDMPAHLKTALTQTSEQIPIRNARLGLGTWQGVYLFEHRHGPQRRELIVHVMGE